MDVDGSSTVHSANFNVDHMTHHFETILLTYNHSMKSFMLTLLADNTNVNKACANKSGVPQVPCHNHLHGLNIGKFVKV